VAQDLAAERLLARKVGQAACGERAQGG
jgi:hypothetical protein